MTPSAQTTHPPPQLLGDSPKMRHLRATIEKIAPLDVTTLIQGPTGTGKELVAKLIHRQSHRGHQPWVAVNCAAIPADLFESQLFGHVRGAFTGAHEPSTGLMQQAQGGTLFLDEVGELPLPLQAKLLRVIEERRVRPIGASHERELNIRLISASHCCLSQLVSQGLFRSDLYHRLRLTMIKTPQLIEIKEDWPCLIDYFMHRAAVTFSLSPKKLTPEAIDKLNRYHFPGNMRELDHCLVAGLIASKSPDVEPEDLDFAFLGETNATHHQTDSIDLASLPSMGLSDAMALTERKLLEQAMMDHANDRFLAAKALRISERSMRYRLKKIALRDN